EVEAVEHDEVLAASAVDLPHPAHPREGHALRRPLVHFFSSVLTAAPSSRSAGGFKTIVSPPTRPAPISTVPSRSGPVSTGCQRTLPRATRATAGFPSLEATAAFGTRRGSGFWAAAASAPFGRNATVTPISGLTTGGFSRNSTRISTVAFCRSAVGQTCRTRPR